MTPLEALEKLNTMFLAYAPRDIREDKELNEDLFECIKSALKDYGNLQKEHEFLSEHYNELTKSYEMEHTLRIRLENINYELVREKQDNEKKLKALCNIEESLKYGYVFIGYNEYNEPLFQFADTKLYEEIKKNMTY